MTAQSKTILFFVFLTIISIRLFGSDIVRKEYNKEINRTFDTSADGEVNIYNKYGTVDIKSWDQNRVKIEVKIIVYASNQDEADNTFDRIDVNFSNRSDYVSAETVIQTYERAWYKFFWKSSGTPEYKIHYTVHMPKTNGLKLETKYCDATMDYLSAGATLHMKYGDFDSDGFGGDVTMYLSYGKGTINTLNNLDGELSYGRLVVANAHDVDLDSKYSKIKIQKAGDLIISSRYDTYILGDIRQLSIEGRYSDYTANQVDDIIFDGRYSDLRIDLLINNGDIESRYGNIIITNLEDGFGLVELYGQYTDFKIGAKMSKAFCVDAESQYGGITIPEVLTKTLNVQEGSAQKISAFMTSHYCSSKIRGVIKYGQLRITH